MANAPINVWNEVRITSEGISISLFSESTDGPAIVEDETWFTFDELDAMSGSEPLSLNLSDETVENLAEQRQSANVAKMLQSENLSEKAEHLPENPSSDELLAYMGLSDMSDVEAVAERQSPNLPDCGTVVRDGNPPSWSDNNELVVVGHPDETASEYVVEETFYGPDDTVADINPSADPDESVVECIYRSEFDGQEVRTSDDIYAFPISRLEW